MATIVTATALDRYRASLKRVEILDAETERELAQSWTEGDQAAGARLIESSLPFVIAIAREYRRWGVPLEDLVQQGNLGLLKAAAKFDPEKSCRLITYAAYWIRAYVLRFLMTNARLIHVGNTRAGRKLFFRLERERQKLLAAGFDPTPKLLAAKLDVDEADVIEVSGHLASREISFEPRPDEEGVPLTERVSRHEASPEDQAARNELAEGVRRLMTEFESSLTDEREAAIWREHLAASVGEPVSLAALGARYGVSKQRMGQIAEKLKKQFRERVLADLGADIQMSWQADEG